MNMCPLSKTATLKFLTQASPLNLCQIYHLSLWLWWILLQVSGSELQLWICLPRLWGGNLPGSLSSLLGPRNAIAFQLSHLFLLFVKDMSYNFQIFYTLDLKLEVYYHNIKIGFL